MENNHRYLPDQLSLNGKSFSFINLPKLFSSNFFKLPVVLRLLLENVIRNGVGEERQKAVKSIFDWLDTGVSKTEICFYPGRILMHDTTSTPALIDISAMRNTLAEEGIDPTVLNPVLPVDVSVDHSLAVDVFGQKDSATLNLQNEICRNKERYQFLRWSSKALPGVYIHPPGTGIMHTINLEQLATVVTTETRDGMTWAVPDTLIGTDSHTPMINGIGVLGWGVGGLEAQTVMFGMPTTLCIPEVIGVKLVGQLASSVHATDLALIVTQKLREMDVTGKFVEFYGSGVTTLTAGERAVIANMAPEYGATTGFFPTDNQTINFLQNTGREINDISLVQAYTKQNGLWFDPNSNPVYTKTIEIDLCSIGINIAGPKRPQDCFEYSKICKILSKIDFQRKNSNQSLPEYPIALAAITSCTNTSDPRLLIAAGLVARNAHKYGLKPPTWVKTSLAPGSPTAATYLAKVGLLDELSSVGFDIVGYGCTTCIGNSGSLTAPIQKAQKSGNSKAVAVLSGNRNFPGRVHPDLELSFIMSPALVVAFSLAGDANKDLSLEPIQTTENGRPIYLKDLWPAKEEIDQYTSRALDKIDFKDNFIHATKNPFWHAIDAPETPLFPWNKKSTVLCRPPFTASSEGSLLGNYKAYPLLVLGDDVTTDHISPASAIPANSFIADYLVAHGDDRNDLNVFASRRGNWKVMLRAAFYSKSLCNSLKPDAPVGCTLHIPSGEVIPIWEVAQRYRQSNDSVVIVAGERYGMGSSRDWAAKGQRLLGVRAVLAVSYERIHRSNLIGMGILPLLLPDGVHPATLKIKPGDQIQINANFESIQIRNTVSVEIHRNNGSIENIMATAAIETQMDSELLEYGGVIPLILQKKRR